MWNFRKDGVILGPRGSGVVHVCGGEGGGEEWDREMPRCSDLLCPQYFPFRRVGYIKEAQRGDKAAKDREHRQSAFVGIWLAYSWAVLCPYIFHFKYMGMRGNDV